jgi:hypothetical protein
MKATNTNSIDASQPHQHRSKPDNQSDKNMVENIGDKPLASLTSRAVERLLILGMVALLFHTLYFSYARFESESEAVRAVLTPESNAYCTDLSSRADGGRRTFRSWEVFRSCVLTYEPQTKRPTEEGKRVYKGGTLREHDTLRV